MGLKWNDIPKEYKPHWSTWTVKGTPYEATQERLAKLGLSDPWARNEVWIYQARKKANLSIPKILLRGWKGGFAAFLVAIALDPYIFPKTEHEHHSEH